MARARPFPAKNASQGSFQLPPRLEGPLLDGHPWIYRQQLSQVPKHKGGSWVEVQAGKFVGHVLWDPDSALAMRVYSREKRPDEAWFLERVSEAWNLRREYLSQQQGADGAFQTTAFRWLNGEGDLLPGIVADFYDGYVVVVLDSPHFRTLLGPVVAAFKRVCPALKGIALKHRDGVASTEDCESAGSRLELLDGELPPLGLVVREYGLLFHVNSHQGQKTGLFLDHRENRRLIERYAAGRRVLNLFAYSGAFSLYAARGGAREVVSVDIAKGAARDAERNFELNGLQHVPHEFVVADVFEYLERCRREGRAFDLVICDPPSFARNQAHLDKAIAAYERVNAAGLKVVAPGGLYAAASCTARVSHDALTLAVTRAARRARRQFQVMLDTHHAPDHPVQVSHPEGRYLKFLLGRVAPRP